MDKTSKMAFGNSENLQNALDSGTINSYDILLLDGDTEPKIGWVDKNGVAKIVSNAADLSGIESELATKANAEDVAELEAVIAAKVNSDEVEAKYEEIKYEIADVPTGTLVNVNEREIRIMCPADTVWTKQTVGEGGDANCYYATFKTYCPSDNAVGYIEHLGDQVDSEILTDLKTDKYGRKYQPSWLALAKYDEAAGTWTYYGANSNADKFIGWNYRIDWYDADNKMIASDSIRINLSNEECHYVIKPYYGASETEEVDTKIDEAMDNAVESANAYTDAQIEAKLAEIADAASYEIVEF